MSYLKGRKTILESRYSLHRELRPVAKGRPPQADKEAYQAWFDNYIEGLSPTGRTLNLRNMDPEKLYRLVRNYRSVDTKADAGRGVGLSASQAQRWLKLLPEELK
jgi:hypothetical protein